MNREGIAASTEREGYEDAQFEITVTPSAVPRAVAALRAAEPSHVPAEPELGLLPTRSAERAAQAHALQKRLREAILELPGVRHAAVLVQLDDASSSLTELLRPGQPPPATANISIVREAGSPLDAEQVRQLAARLLPGLTPAALQLSERTEAVSCGPCAQLSHLGEVTVTSTTLSTLKLWLGASLLAHMLSAVALLVLLHRRRARREP